MLDDVSVATLTRPVYCVLGSDFFTSRTKTGGQYSFNLLHIQKLIRNAGMFRYFFASADDEDHLIYDWLNTRIGFHFAALISRETMTSAQIKETVQAADIVYAPMFCQAKDIYPVLTPPSSVEALLHVIEYFSVTGVPFSVEEYKRILV